MFVSLHLNSTEKPGPKGHASIAFLAESSDEATRRLVEFENREPVSIEKHSEDEKMNGVSDILWTLTRHQAQIQTRRLAELIQARLSEASPYPNRGVKQAPIWSAQRHCDASCCM